MEFSSTGASGAIGTRLVAQLDRPRARGRRHPRTGPANAARVSALGRCRSARPARRGAVRAVVLAAAPDAIVHQATALSGLRTSSTSTAASPGRTDCGRRAPTPCSPPRGWPGSALRRPELRQRRYERTGGPVKTEDDPLDPTPVPAMRESDAAIATSTAPVRRPAGSRCATALLRRRERRDVEPSASGYSDRRRRRRRDVVHPPRRRRRGDRPRARPRGGGIFNIVDDDPAPTREWLPVLAEVLGAKPPRHVPRWLAKLVAGEAAVMLGTVSRGASNAKARRELGWEPRYPSWRQGFVAAYAPAAAPSVRLREVA